MLNLFLHIPKTGGMSLQTALKWVYGPENCYSIPTKALREPNRTQARFPPSRIHHFDLMMGHFFFGLHRQFDAQCRYFTLLRDPVQRVVSHYYYNKAQNPGTRLASMSLREFVASDASIAQSNRQVRFLSGEDPTESPHAALEVAKEHLGACAAFGITERFDESLLLFRRQLGWGTPPFYVHRKVNSERPAVDDLPTRVLEAVREQNRLDIELYTFARDRFEQIIEDKFSHLDALLRRFRRRNSLFQTIAPPFIWLYRATRWLRPKK